MMNGRLCTKIMMSIVFVSVMPVWAMDIEVPEKKPDMIVAITTKSLVWGRTVDRYVFGNENRKKCAQLGWNYGADDKLVEVAISCKNLDGETIDCLKTNPTLLRKALLKKSLNNESRTSTLASDLTTPQFPRYIPMYVLSAPEDIILEVHGCAIKAEVFIADGLENDSFVSFKNTLCLVAGGFGLTVISCLLLLENMKLFGT